MTKKRPQYQIIKSEIYQKIESGFYKENDIIPTENELAETYKVSRVTVRKAIEQLVNDGYLKRTPGFGTVVQPNITLKKTIRHIGFKDEMMESNKEVLTKVTEFTLKEADAQISNILGICEKEMVYYFTRIRYENGIALQIEHSFMPVKKFPDLNVVYLENSKFNYVENIKNLKIDMSIQTVIPLHAGKEIGEVFHISPDTPILKICNTTYLKDGTVMDYTEQYQNSPRYQTKFVKFR